MKKILPAILAISLFSSCAQEAPPQEKTQAEKDAAFAQALEQYAKENPRKTWEYGSQADQMSGDSSFTAENRSTNTHFFDFPYQSEDGSYLFLYLLKRQGKPVLTYCYLPQGQLQLEYDGTPIRVKFDDGPVMNFNGVGSSDHDSKYVYLEPETKFIKNLKTCKEISIEVPVFQEGRRVFKFKNDGLVWNR